MPINFALSAVTCSASNPFRALGITSCSENPARTKPTAADSAPAATAKACPHAQMIRVGLVTSSRSAACARPGALDASNPQETDAGDFTSPGNSATACPSCKSLSPAKAPQCMAGCTGLNSYGSFLWGGMNREYQTSCQPGKLPLRVPIILYPPWHRNNAITCKLPVCPLFAHPRVKHHPQRQSQSKQRDLQQ
jgi:hypothetical protein